MNDIHDNVLMPRERLASFLVSAGAAFQTLLVEAARHPETEARAILVNYYGHRLTEGNALLALCAPFSTEGDGIRNGLIGNVYGGGYESGAD